ncbi:hypothetical protein [Frankia sp. Cj3]|uniref:hypothetical protein n=1 Tax=Frankia sp. Cj3 TaxID=2880976 RepID=UPI001EF42723|nr:hypothetical protein [Frankia sp. Cj3]
MVVTVVGLVVLALLIAVGAVLDRQYTHPSRTPQKLTYCGRHYLRGGPVMRAEAESAGGSLVAVGRTPGGAALFGPGRLTVVAGEMTCPTVVLVADPDDTHLVTYTLSGGP